MPRKKKKTDELQFPSGWRGWCTFARSGPGWATPRRGRGAGGECPGRRPGGDAPRSPRSRRAGPRLSGRACELERGAQANLGPGQVGTKTPPPSWARLSIPCSSIRIQVGAGVEPGMMVPSPGSGTRRGAVLMAPARLGEPSPAPCRPRLPRAPESYFKAKERQLAVRSRWEPAECLSPSIPAPQASPQTQALRSALPGG